MQDPTDKLLGLLDEISENLVLDTLEDPVHHQETIQQIYNGFVSVYKDPVFRHSYASLSKHLDHYGGDERDSLPVGLLAVVQYSEEVSGASDASDESKRVHRSLCKLLDHIELECIRLNRMDLVKHHADQAQAIVESAQQINSDTTKSAEEAQTLVTRIHEQSITILGLFSAVIIGFVAELSLFVKGFENLSKDNFLPVVLYSSFVGMLVFDTLFMLMFAVSKASGTSIGVRCRQEHCANCTVHKFWLRRIYCKYPYLVYFNLLCIIISIAVYFQIKP